MNKQEFIEKLKRDLTMMSEIKEKKYEYDKGYERAIKEHLEMLCDLDWPDKPVVPQFVADWYEENKDDFEYSVQCLCVQSCEPVREIDAWFDSDDTKPIETLVMMHKFGYEVEEEKKYRVILKGTPDYLVDTVTNGFRFYNNIYTDKREHTRKELEANGFGWVFDCEGIAIEEVEE